jgi:glutathione peroxidase
MTTAHEFTMKTIDGANYELSQLRGKVVVFVNVASRCGYTSQYTGLEKLHREMKDKGVVVVGVPCNQFGAQEPGTEADIKTFCTTKYDVTFPMMSKVDVNGPNAHPLYQWLTSNSGGSVKWNFAKFVVGKDGKMMKHFDSGVAPDGAEMKAVLNTALSS